MSENWNKIISDKAMKIAMAYEQDKGRKPNPRHQDGVGYDIVSQNNSKQRYIEVKGVSEKWNTYTWQSLYASEVECLRKNSDNFYLYIIHFELEKNNRTQEGIEKAPYAFYIIPSAKLLSNEFNIKPETFALKPISQRKLHEYQVNV